jgi:hypothetical protein
VLAIRPIDGPFPDDDGDFEYWLVREGEHAGNYAFKRGLNSSVFDCDSQEEARADADRMKKFSGL